MAAAYILQGALDRLANERRQAAATDDAERDGFGPDQSGPDEADDGPFGWTDRTDR